MTDSPSDSPPTAALAPEEWDALPESITLYNYAPPALSRHSVAALCLYQQPFGFSHEDVARLRSLRPDSTWGPGEWWESRGEDIPDAGAWLLSLASRIASLLPPDPREPI